MVNLFIGIMIGIALQSAYNIAKMFVHKLPQRLKFERTMQEHTDSDTDN